MIDAATGGTGWIMLPGGAVDCAFVQRSKFGAKLHVTGVRDIPNEFKLAIGATNEVHDVIVVWQAADEFGVRYKDGKVA